MAVVSISRIQVRRGRKLEGTGLPQLASGEFGWAVDTQELYIGNGSVAEGAPLVGNTKILTENDNILAFASLYEYKAGSLITGFDANNPIQRTIQERLDESVTVKSFGATGNGTDQTAQLQRAINQLFDRQGAPFNTGARMVLEINAGDYLISDTITLPPNCVLKGAGKGRTVITKNTPGPAFQTVTATNGNTASPGNVDVQGLTLLLNSASGFLIESCTNSVFKDIEVSGEWSLGDGEDLDLYGFKLESVSQETKDNVFDDIKMNGVSEGFYSVYDVNNNKIINSDFAECNRAISFGQSMTIGADRKKEGPSRNLIQNNVFDLISDSAILIETGDNNLLESNKFYTVGYNYTNDVFDKRDPIAPVVECGVDTKGNTSVSDWFERTQEYALGALYNTFVPYVAEIKGPVHFTNSFVNRLDIQQITQPATLIKLPAEETGNIKIEYVYKSGEYNSIRKGTLDILVDPTTISKTLTDEYSFAGNNAIEEQLEFGAELFDENNDGAIDSIGISVLNLSFNDQAELSFSISTFR